MKKKSRFLQTPIEPFAVEAGLSATKSSRGWTHLLPGPTSPPHIGLAEDAPGRRDDLHGDGGSAVGGRLAPGGRPPDPSSLRRLSGVDWREPLPRSARDARAAPCTSDRRTRTMRRWPKSASIACTTPTRAKKSSSPTTTGSRILRPRSRRGRSPPEFLHLLGGHLWKTTNRTDSTAACQRADFLPGHRRLFDRNGLAGASEGARRRSHRHHRRHRRIGEPRDPPAADGIGRPWWRCPRTSSTRRAYRPSSTATRSAATATPCKSSPTCRISAARRVELRRGKWGKLATDSARVSVQADATTADPLQRSRHHGAAAREADRAGLHPGRPRDDGRRSDRSQRTLRRGSE